MHLLLSTLFFHSALSTFLESLAHKPVTVHLAHEADIDYQCPICTEPLTEPYLSIECGHHFCQQCRNHLLSIGKTECPTCREPDVLTNAVLDKNVQRKVKSLKVRCSDYKEGCEWVGELRDLHDHLDPAKGRCGIALLHLTPESYQRVTSEVEEVSVTNDGLQVHGQDQVQLQVCLNVVDIVYNST